LYIAKYTNQHFNLYFQRRLTKTYLIKKTRLTQVTHISRRWNQLRELLIYITESVTQN